LTATADWIHVGGGSDIIDQAFVPRLFKAWLVLDGVGPAHHIAFLARFLHVVQFFKDGGAGVEVDLVVGVLVVIDTWAHELVSGAGPLSILGKPLF